MPNPSQDPGTVDPASPLPPTDPERIINPPRPDAAPGETSAERIINPPRPDAAPGETSAERIINPPRPDAETPSEA